MMLVGSIAMQRYLSSARKFGCPLEAWRPPSTGRITPFTKIGSEIGQIHAPYGGPRKLAFAVLIENGQYGGTAAAPLAAALMKEAKSMGYFEGPQ